MASNTLSTWEDWLQKLARDGKGGLGGRGRPEIRAIDRGLDYEYIFAIEADLSADTLTASIKASPDAGSSLADFTVAIGSYTNDMTEVTLSLTDAETAALPSDTDFNGLEEMVFDILWTPLGGVEQRLMGGVIYVSGKVT